jgi:hypothetical protein
MIDATAENRPHNTQKGSFECCEDASGPAQMLREELERLGVVLSIDPAGGLAFDAPAEVAGEELLARLRSHRDALLALLERTEERAAIVEHDGEPAPQVDPEPAGPSYLPALPAVVCPWCHCGDRLREEADALACDACGRVAWWFEDASAVRADWRALLEVHPVGVG